jgi:hypothetical protein
VPAAPHSLTKTRVRFALCSCGTHHTGNRFFTGFHRAGGGALMGVCYRSVFVTMIAALIDDVGR